ncbi:MAG TPA: DMT family transporter [Usitatibacter sp.]|nr:DMT family transporter [Usitatibacter sp.]
MSRIDVRTASLLTVPPLLWAGNAVVGALVVGAIPPLALNAARWALALLILLPLGWRVLGHPRALLERWRHFALIGLIGIGSYNAFQYYALRTSSPVNVTLIAAAAPVWMVLVGRVGYGVRPSWRQGAGAALSVLGVFAVLSRGSLATLLAMRFVAGDLFMLAAGFVWAIYSWMLARPPESMCGERRPKWNWAELLTAQLVFGAAWAIAAALVEWTFGPQYGPFTPKLALAVLFVAFGPAVIAYWAWGAGVARVGPTIAALFSNLTPLFAALLALLMLGQAPRWYHAVAFAFIAGGIVVSTRR